MIQPAFEILNQRGTPMFFSDVFSNRPAAGIVGRIFISTDTKEFYRDTGSTWELLGGPGAGTITGSGTTGTLSKFTSSSSIGDSIVSEIGSALNINGTAKATNWYVGTPTDLTRAFSASGNANNVALYLEEYGNTTASADVFMYKGRGTESAKANIQIGDSAGAISTGGYLNGVLFPTSNWYAEVVNIDTVNNHADTDWKLTQSYNSAGTTETFRIRASDGNVIAPNGSFQNILTKTAISTEGWYGLVSTENITIPSNTSFSNLGFSLGSFAGSNLMTYQGNATFGNANATTSVFGTNGFAFSNVGSTITINQRSGGTNAFAGVTAYNYINGTTNGTITHLAGLHVLAPYQSSSAILSVTNYYGALINASNERTAFNITNRWGIYQEGVSDINYFASKVLIGSTTDIGVSKLQVTGNGNFTGSVSATGLYGYILRGRSSDNYGAFGFYSNDGLTRYGYIQSHSTNGGQLAINADGGGQLIMDSRGNIFNTGNVAIGVIPSAWGSSYKAIDIASGSLWGSSSLQAVFLSQNVYFDTSYKYTSNGYASDYYQYLGQHVWQNAPSGTAGTAISFTKAMTLTNGGNLLLGSSSDPGQKLYLNGSLRIDGQTSGTAGGNSGQHLIINCDGTTYKIALLNP